MTEVASGELRSQMVSEPPGLAVSRIQSGVEGAHLQRQDVLQHRLVACTQRPDVEPLLLVRLEESANNNSYQQLRGGTQKYLESVGGEVGSA